MINELEHDMVISPNRDERSRQEFVSALRAHVLGDMANSMREHYHQDVEPAFERAHGRKPADGAEVHKAMQGDDYFRYYSSVRRNAQEMTFRSVIPVSRPPARGIERAGQQDHRQRRRNSDRG